MKHFNKFTSRALHTIKQHKKTDILFAFAILLFAFSLLYNFVLKSISFTSTTQPTKLTTQNSKINSPKSQIKNQLNTATVELEKSTDTQPAAAFGAILQSAKNTTSSLKQAFTNSLSIEGQKICATQDSLGKTELYIKDSNAKLIFTSSKNTKSQVLLNGDCVYSWDNNIKGTKTCGVSSYIGMFNMALNSGLVNNSQITTELKNQGFNVNLDELQKSCKQQNVGATVFTIPQGVNFAVQELNLDL